MILKFWKFQEILEKNVKKKLIFFDLELAPIFVKEIFRFFCLSFEFSKRVQVGQEYEIYEIRTLSRGKRLMYKKNLIFR